jgi:hypothetical protein
MLKSSLTYTSAVADSVSLALQFRPVRFSVPIVTLSITFPFYNFWLGSFFIGLQSGEIEWSSVPLNTRERESYIYCWNFPFCAKVVYVCNKRITTDPCYLESIEQVFSWGRLQLKCDGAHDARGRGNWRMEWVASTLHTTSERGVSIITTADTHTSAASSRLNWRPRRFKWTRPFRRRQNLVSARVPTYFKRSLTVVSCI